jgi:hypothetical protein
MKLKYDGKGKYIMGIPARDLDEQDIEMLIASGMFDNEQAVIDALTSKGLYSMERKYFHKIEPSNIDIEGKD